MEKRRGLGRGLDALLGPAAAEGATTLPLQAIQPGAFQPRRHIAPQTLDDLAASIRSQGVLQPILVRRHGSNGYEIIAGERRWRA
jgi:ParB family chromosome partitioning protein